MKGERPSDEFPTESLCQSSLHGGGIVEAALLSSTYRAHSCDIQRGAPVVQPSLGPLTPTAAAD